MTKLYEKIAKVSEAIGALAADKRNAQQDYDYISADKVLERAGRAMAENGLVVIPAIAHEATEEVTYQSYGKTKTRYDCVVELDMTVACNDGGSVTQHWVSRGVDYASPDKALFKAVTSGHKYFLMKLFNVGIGNEDGEHQGEPEDRRGASSPQAQAKRKRPGQNGDKPPMATDAQKRKMHAIGNPLYGDDWDTKRGDIVEAITKKRENGPVSRSSNDLYRGEMEYMIRRLEEKEAEQKKEAEEA